MEIVKLIFWIIAAYGMATIVVYGEIFHVPRVWIKTHSKFFGSMIECILCTATWVGFLFSILLGSLSKSFFHFLPLNILIDGCFTTGGVWALNAIIEWFEENRPKKIL